MMMGRSQPSWLNLGYWEPETRSYAEACRALARRVATAVGLSSGDEVLEVGCGYGEAAMLWVEEMIHVGAEPPRILALNITPAHVQLANQRLRERPLCSPHVTFELGDAVDVRLDPERFDKVIALECAFHFRTRARFLANAYMSLKPGGRLALTDFMLFPSTARRIDKLRQLFSRRLVDPILRRGSELLAQPAENLCTEQEYCATLTAIGFRNIQIEPLYDRTVVPFRTFCRRRLRAIARQGIPGTLGFRLLMHLYLLLMQTNNYVLISADKVESLA